MTDFDLFDNACEDVSPSCDVSTLDDECTHDNIITDNGVKMCSDCGIELVRDIIFEKDWRYYGSADTKHSTDPTRCHARKEDDRIVYKDVLSFGFSNKIVSLANDIYTQVTNGKIYRGNSRKAIIFACIFHAYKISGQPQSCETLRNIFSLDRKVGLKGLKLVNNHAPKDSKIRTTYITPLNLVEDIMNKFNATPAQKTEIVALYEKIKNKSSIINRSRPQSVGAGLIYYYHCKHNNNINIKDFIAKVGLSELTINKIAKEIAKILE